MVISKEKLVYPMFHRILHHLIAFGILFQFTKVLGRATEGSIVWNFYKSIPNWHGSFGVIIMVLVITKLIYAIVSKIRGNGNTIYDVKRSLSVKIGHTLLNLFMFITPFTAACFIISKGYPIKVFGLQLLAGGQVLPEMLAKCVANLGSLHSPFAIILMVLVIGHIGMAVIHKLRKDDSLAKM